MVGILALSHQDDTFYGIRIIPVLAGLAGRIDGICPAHFTKTGQVGDLHLRHIFYKDWDTIVILDDNILDLIDIVEQTNTPYYISLGILFNDVTADIDIAFSNCIINVQRSDPQVVQHLRIYLDLIGLDLSPEADNVCHSRHTAQLAVYYPVL